MKKQIFRNNDVTTAQKPWTHLNFGGGGDSEDFNFIVVGDRSGRPQPGVFEDAITKINLLNPNFVMSVGDFIPGINMEDSTESFVNAQWDYFESLLKKCEPPFFRVVGNHDISPECEAFPGLNAMMTRVWKKRFGVTYYSFVFKNVLFVCLNIISEEGIDEQQMAWVSKTLEQNQKVKWTMLFMHAPMAWKHESFLRLENLLNERNYTFFAGDFHYYNRFRRQGRNYYMLGLTGSASPDAGIPPRGVMFGEFQHLTWVSFKNCEPRVLLLGLDGLYLDDVVTTRKLTWRTPRYLQLDKPIDPTEADRLEKMGLKIHREIDKWEF